VNLDLDRSVGLTIDWSDGRQDHLTVGMLRRLSPSAEAKATRDELSTNPLAVLRSSPTETPLSADRLELVGNYAIRIIFSDGHRTGLYTWAYLRELADIQTPEGKKTP
jgi:DUF971 family protein